MSDTDDPTGDPTGDASGEPTDEVPVTEPPAEPDPTAAMPVTAPRTGRSRGCGLRRRSGAGHRSARRAQPVALDLTARHRGDRAVPPRAGGRRRHLLPRPVRRRTTRPTTTSSTSTSSSTTTTAAHDDHDDDHEAEPRRRPVDQHLDHVDVDDQHDVDHHHEHVEHDSLRRSPKPEAMTAEHDRISGVDADRWRAWGPFLAERSWGTVREDYSPDGEAWELVPVRPRPLAGLPLGRGRHGRAVRPPPGAVPRPGAVERRRPDPQGAALRPRRQGGQPRRGREGVLLVPRRRAQPQLAALALPLPAGRVPLRRPARRERPAGLDEPEYELLDTGIFDDGRFFSVEVAYAKRDPDDICMRITARNHGDRPAPLHLLPQLWFRNVWSWGTPTRRTPSLPGCRSARTARR